MTSVKAMETKFFGDPHLCPPGMKTVPTPLGRVCSHCEEGIWRGDSGVIISQGLPYHPPLLPQKLASYRSLQMN